MIIKAEQKNVITSPIKLRFVANSIRGLKSPIKMLAYLEYVQKQAAEPIAKVIKQAIANAKNNQGLDTETLIVKELVIDQGPTYKRGQIVARGRFHPIEKRTSHIRVLLETIEKERNKAGKSKK